MPYIIAYVDIIYFYFPICYNSEWGYYRDKNSGNCVLDPNCGPELDCLTGYVIVCNVVQCIAMHALYNHESIIKDPWHSGIAIIVSYIMLMGLQTTQNIT